MKNADLWEASKFILNGNRLIASNNNGLSSRNMANYIAEFYTDNIPKYCKGMLLDLGCGSVPLYELYKKYINDVICVDWESGKHTNKHIDKFCNLNKIIPFLDSQFSTIIMSDVIEHIIDPKLLLTEILRLLVPGGVLIFNYPFMYGIHESPYDYNRPTHFYIHEMAAKVGFNVLVQVQFGGMLDVIETIVLKESKKVRGGGFFEKILWNLMRVINTKKRIRQVKDNDFCLYPLGYGFVLEKPK